MSEVSEDVSSEPLTPDTRYRTIVRELLAFIRRRPAPKNDNELTRRLNLPSWPHMGSVLQNNPTTELTTPSGHTYTASANRRSLLTTEYTFIRTTPAGREFYIFKEGRTREGLENVLFFRFLPKDAKPDEEVPKTTYTPGSSDPASQEILGRFESLVKDLSSAHIKPPAGQP